MKFIHILFRFGLTSYGLQRDYVGNVAISIISWIPLNALNFIGISSWLSHKSHYWSSILDDYSALVLICHLRFQ